MSIAKQVNLFFHITYYLGLFKSKQALVHSKVFTKTTWWKQYTSLWWPTFMLPNFDSTVIN